MPTKMNAPERSRSNTAHPINTFRFTVGYRARSFIGPQVHEIHVARRLCVCIDCVAERGDRIGLDPALGAGCWFVWIYDLRFSTYDVDGT